MSKAAEKKKTCIRGHTYTGSGPCPVCWPGRLKKEKEQGKKDELGPVQTRYQNDSLS